MSNSALRHWAIGLACLALAACSSAPVRKAEAPKVNKPASTAAARPAPPPVVGTPPPPGWEAAPQGGGYYMDDGPGDIRPANLDEMQSAEPQLEPIQANKTRPYQALGQTFYPQKTLEEPYKQQGRASWYGRKFHGAKTATGEIYDMHQMTAAHPTLPLPSYAKVTNLYNGKSVIVRVNDRGPFMRNRVIDLSYAAAYKLDYINHGSADVIVEKLTPDMIAAYQAAKQAGQDPVAALNRKDRATSAQAQPAINTAPVQTVALPSIAYPAAPATTAAPSGSVYLQMGAFGSKSSADNLLNQINPQIGAYGQRGQILSESGLHRVLVGPFTSLEQAQSAATQLAVTTQIKPLVKQDLILP
ncbi:MAG: septal ring lytic transglycosylase RlpA family protein [Limnobacter sp.]|uniref:septal ring lytic transglycosylase RlpA family protein n=1 Tax=Limnobacter sp. TaxID=2003368 RepID=UPI00391DC559